MLHSPVYVRLRPSEEDHLVRPHDSEQLGLTVNDEFFFDSTSVLVNSSQEDTFRTIGVPLVDETLKGVSSTLLTYGGEGSGKTYSLFGGEKEHEKGLIQRALELLIEKKGLSDLSVSFYEVTAQDQLVDLLQPRQPVNVSDLVRNSSTVLLDRTDQVLRLVKSVHENRSESSHQITTIEVTRNDVTAGKVCRSRLFLVDLASACSPLSSVARQLSLLESVIVALGSRKASHVPFRQCRLTQALQVALGERSNIALLCTVRPQRAHLSETLASLRFAARVAKIPITRNYVQTEPDPLLHAAVLKDEVESLRRELQVQCLLSSGKHAIGTEPLTLNQLSEVNRQVEEYLVGGPLPDIISNRQLHAVFASFRTILTKSTGQEQESSETDILTKSSKPRSAQPKGAKGKNEHKEEKGKKEPEMARAASRKANKEDRDSNDKKGGKNARDDKSGKEMERKSSKQSNNTPIQSESVMDIMNNDLNDSGELILNEQPDRETSFRMFGEGEGRELIRLLREAEKEAFEKEEKAYDCALMSNDRIELRNQLKNVKFGTQLPDGRRVISEDELLNIRRMRKLKEEILEHRQQYEILKAQAEYCREQSVITAERVMLEFEAWEQRSFQTQVSIDLSSGTV